MSDYISREAAIEDFEYCTRKNSTWTPQRVKTLLMRIPAADVEPVRYGRWEPGNQICPVCGEDKFKDLDADIWSDWTPPRCPNCGAKMFMGGITVVDCISRPAFIADCEGRYCAPCKEQGKDSNGMKCRACWVDDMLSEVMDAPAADVEPEQLWIPCRERLPEICMINGELVNYLIYCPDFSSCGAAVDIGNYVPDAGTWFCLGIPCRVTHWAPLPEPPEEGESDHG
mgnify:CR=1 FL=1